MHVLSQQVHIAVAIPPTTVGTQPAGRLHGQAQLCWLLQRAMGQT